MLRIIGLAVAALMLGTINPTVTRADGCYICRSGSSCGQYCRYSGKDNYKKRKACIKAGCKIGGTASCSSASNIRICSGIGFIINPDKQFASVDALLALAGSSRSQVMSYRAE